MPLGSAMSGPGSRLAQEASNSAKQKSRAILVQLTAFRSEICASINDSISGLYLDPAGQTAGNDIADGSRRFN